MKKMVFALNVNKQVDQRFKAIKKINLSKVNVINAKKQKNKFHKSMDCARIAYKFRTIIRKKKKIKPNIFGENVSNVDLLRRYKLIFDFVQHVRIIKRNLPKNMKNLQRKLCNNQKSQII